MWGGTALTRLQSSTPDAKHSKNWFSVVTLFIAELGSTITNQRAKHSRNS